MIVLLLTLCTILTIVAVPLVTVALLRRNELSLLLDKLLRRKRPAAQGAALVMENLLERLQVKPDKSMLPDAMPFEFQGGHFVATFRAEDEPFPRTVSLSYFNCFSCDTAHIELLTLTANHINSLTLPIKCSMTPDNEAAELNVSLHVSGVRLAADENSAEYLRQLLLTFFHMQRSLIDYYEKLEEESPSDVIREHLINASTRNLLLNIEERYRAEEQKRPHHFEPMAMTLGALVRSALDKDMPRGGSLTVNGTPAELTADAADVPVLAYVVRGTGADVSPVAHAAELTVTWPDADDLPALHVSLRVESVTERVLMVRVTVTEEGQPLATWRPEGAEELRPHSVTLLVGVPRVSEQSLQAEDDYMAREQGLIEQCKSADAARMLYRGRIMLADKRLLEAVHYLGNAFSLMLPKVDHPEDVEPETLDTFYGLCYALGQAYAEMGLYQRAYYYIDLIVNQNRLQWTRLYVVILMALRDPRLPSLIQSLRDTLQHHIDENGSDEVVDDFLTFLDRQEILLFIRGGHIREASTLLNAILQRNPDDEFALTLLTRLSSGSK